VEAISVDDSPASAVGAIAIPDVGVAVAAGCTMTIAVAVGGMACIAVAVGGMACIVVGVGGIMVIAIGVAPVTGTSAVLTAAGAAGVGAAQAAIRPANRTNTSRRLI
jgi:hypothetical protein